LVFPFTPINYINIGSEVSASGKSAVLTLILYCNEPETGKSAEHFYGHYTLSQSKFQNLGPNDTVTS